ncbi:MAG: YtzH-like family protein [Bacillus sp. (in: Bacteria)]|nr:YtzH-like family protein [Bacillus sp. (in: firmicutes)]
MIKEKDLLHRLRDILKEQQYMLDGEVSQFQEMNRIIDLLPYEELNKNFHGTIEEINTYVNNLTTNQPIKEHIEVNKPNISRWLEELEMLEDGGGAVTIDYEQRKGREI